MDDTYSSRHQADVAELEEFLQALGERLASPVEAYLIGGCNMALRGLKDATKDMDTIVETRAGRLELERVMEVMDYEKTQADPFTKFVPREYEGFRGDLYRKEGCVGLDVFERIVMDKFCLTKGMKERATEVRYHGNLRVHMVSNEDVCLFKSITYRPDDDDDVMILVGQGLDVETMRGALREQPVRTGVPWPAHVAKQLRDIARRKGVDIPWIDRLA